MNIPIKNISFIYQIHIIMEFSNFLEFKIYTSKFNSLEEIIIGERKFMINTINPHSYCVTKVDHEFKKALIDSDLILPDGSGITFASKILNGKSIKKYSGPELHLDLLKLANKLHKKIFYLGSSISTLKLIEERIEREYPNIKIETYSPPFKELFSDQDNQEMVKAVNKFNPDFLFVGMTAPKQEKWTFHHKKELNAKVICSIGAAFDFFAGTVKLPPQWMIDAHLQWLHRLCKEPKRMWKRNFISTPLFLWDILLYKLEIKKVRIQHQ